MAQVTVGKVLPGIVTDQPEIFESIPDEDIDDVNEAGAINSDEAYNEPMTGDFDYNEVPIKDAFSYFAEGEQKIAQFFIQRYGEYKIKSDKLEEETDVEKYHRLAAEITELLDKFKFRKDGKVSVLESTKIDSLNTTKIVDNLEQLSSQLKVLEYAANDGSLNQTQSELINIKSKLQDIDKTCDCEQLSDKPSKTSVSHQDDAARLLRMSNLEKRINNLEKIFGNNTDKERSLFERTNCENFREATDVLSSWLAHFKPGNFDKVNKELEYLIRKFDLVQGLHQSSFEGHELDADAKTALNKLCNMVTATDKHRAMVPTIVHRLNALEELQRRAAHVTKTVNDLEQVQSQIADAINLNQDDLKSLKTMFAKNIDLMKDFSADIDSRISSIKNKDDT